MPYFPLRVSLGRFVNLASTPTDLSSGYTLVETLAALFVVGLAVTGLSSAFYVLDHEQARIATIAARTKAQRDAEITLSRWFERLGPFRSYEPERFSGDQQKFQFDCDEAEPCSVQLVRQPDGLALQAVDGGKPLKTMSLLYAGEARFQYVGSRTVMDAWPTEKPEREILHSISLVGVKKDQGELPIAELRLWPEQFIDCHFDAIIQDCVAQ